MKKRIDRKLFLILLGYVGAYHVVYIFRRIILKAMDRPEYAEVSWWRVTFEPVLANFVIVPPVIVLILIVTKKMIDSKLKWAYVFLIHFGLSFIYSFIITAFGYIYEYFFLGTIFFGGTFKEFIVRTMFGSNLNFLGYVGFVTIIYSYYYIQRVGKTELQKVQLTQQLQNVKMQALKSQLNPHFLFNTLNSISSLIKEDIDRAQQMLGNLGDLLREILLVKDENLIPVDKEMVILNKYLDIMKTRFSEDLSVKIEVEEDVENVLIPSMLIQPIMENSIKYGYSYDSTYLEVELRIFKINEKVCLEIRNNGPQISENNGKNGLGIANIKERLKTLFDDDFSFSFSNLEDGQGVKTTIVLPSVLSN